jgi:hypothetical protein
MEPSASLADLLHAWHDFYALMGAASATLAGLLFVAASIGSNYFREEHRGPLASFLTPTVVHFAAILFASLLASAPSQSWRSLGLMLGAGALAGLIYSARVLFDLALRRRSPRKLKVDLDDRFFYGLMPALGYLALLTAAALLLAQSPAGVELMAAASLVLLFASIRNAWDMTLWTATKSPSDAGPPS